MRSSKTSHKLLQIGAKIIANWFKLRTTIAIKLHWTFSSVDRLNYASQIWWNVRRNEVIHMLEWNENRWLTDLFTMAGDDQVKCPKSHSMSHGQTVRERERESKRYSQSESVSLHTMQIIKIDKLICLYNQTNILHKIK